MPRAALGETRDIRHAIAMALKEAGDQVTAKFLDARPDVATATRLGEEYDSLFRRN